MFFTKMKYFNLVLALFIAFSPATAIRSEVAQENPKAAKQHAVDYAPMISKLKEELPRLMDKRMFRGWCTNKHNCEPGNRFDDRGKNGLYAGNQDA